MRSTLIILVAAMILVATPAFAELQNLTVGGAIRIRGNYWTTGASEGIDSLRWGAGLLPQRAPGPNLLTYPVVGPNNIHSAFSWSEDEGHNLKFVEQRTRLNFKADFTNDVAAFIEIDSYDIWGTSFRSDYLTGGDFRGGADVEIYQSYIELNESFSFPLRLRIGRQEMSLGSEWLVGTNDARSLFTGLSFDGIRATWATDVFSIDAWWSKLAERSPIEEDGDVDFYGIYASYYGIEDITIDAYWLYIRDAIARRDTADIDFGFFKFPQIIEDWFGVDDYSVTQLHTVGLRGAGTFGAFDFELEGAWQFGEADAAGFFYRTGIYGDDDADWNEWAVNGELGYTFDMVWTPRVYLGFAYLGGDDQRDVNFWEWLVALFNPFYQPDASVSFNRLFSNWEYSEFLDLNGNLSNVMIFRGGVSAMPTENIEVLLSVSYFEAIEEWDEPWNFYFLGTRIVPLFFLPWFTEEVDSEIGWEVSLHVTYNYSEDLTFEVGWAHFFVGDGLQDGQFIQGNGHFFNGGGIGSWFGRERGDDDADYVYFETRIRF